MRRVSRKHEWIAIASKIWDAELYINIYRTTHSCTIVLRKKRDGDKFMVSKDNIRNMFLATKEEIAENGFPEEYIKYGV